MEKLYLCIDLKSFYASVECVERKLDPMTTNLVVADPERDRGTICLAVSPSLKALGVPNRCRIFQIPPGIDYIMAPPRMQLYINYSANIYAIYLKYLSKEDIFVYSIDEAFLDITDYIPLYETTAEELAARILRDIRESIGVTAVCGIGTNLYLSKIAMDITAKHTRSHISYLDETRYRETLWNHRPLTDFWRIGKGIARQLNDRGIMTMKDLAHTDEKLLFKMFGVDSDILLDHAWGREPTTIAEIKSYQPKHHGLSSGQVLMRDYTYEEGLIIVKEMTDLLCLDLIDKHLVTNSVSLYIGYSKHAADAGSVHGSQPMSVTTNSVKLITRHTVELYSRIVNPALPIKRVNISFNQIMDEAYEQLDLFTDPRQIEKDRKIQQAVLDIKKKFGSNAVLRGMDLLPSATTQERNGQIGGHKSGIT